MKQVPAVVVIVEGRTVSGDEMTDLFEHLLLYEHFLKLLAWTIIVVVENQACIALVEVHFVEDGLEIRVISIGQRMPVELDHPRRTTVGPCDVRVDQ